MVAMVFRHLLVPEFNLGPHVPECGTSIVTEVGTGLTLPRQHCCSGSERTHDQDATLARGCAEYNQKHLES